MKKAVTDKKLIALAPLLLFVVFAACILLVLLSGADIYQQIIQRDQMSMQNRTISQYLTTRLRQSDTENMVLVGNFDETSTMEGDTLYVYETINGRIYCTRIYAHDGMLRELFAAEGISFLPENGTGILPLEDLYFTLDNNLLNIEITYKDASTETLHIVLRTEEESL